MTYSPRLHQGLRAWLRPWLNILWPHEGGTSRCEGGMCPPAPSVLNISQFLTDQEVEGMWESHTDLWLIPAHCKGWVRQPVEGSGMHGKRP